MADAKRIIIGSEVNDSRHLELDSIGALGKITVPVSLYDSKGNQSSLSFDSNGNLNVNVQVGGGSSSSTVTANQGGTWSVRMQDGSGNSLVSASSGTSATITGYLNTVPKIQNGGSPSVGSGQFVPFQCDSGGNLLVNISNLGLGTLGNSDANSASIFSALVFNYNQLYNGTTWDRWRGDTTNGAWVNVKTGTVAATQSGTWNVGTVTTVTTVGAVTAITNALPAGSNTIGAVSQNGTWNVGTVTTVTAVTAITSALPAGTNLMGKVGIDQTTVGSTNGVSLVPTTSGGLSVALNSIKATATAIKTSAGQVMGWYIYNANAAVSYVQFYNALTANVTVGTTAAVYSIGIPPTSGANVLFETGIAHSTAITIAATTTVGGNTGPSSNVDINIFYK